MTAAPRAPSGHGLRSTRPDSYHRGVDQGDLELPVGVDLGAAIETLRAHGARFAYLHGSRALGTARPDSDLDVAAWFDRRIGSWEVPLGDGIDLLVLDTAGLELGGPVALRGRLLFDDDPPTRVAWQADTSKRYLDESHRRDLVVATVLGRG